MAYKKFNIKGRERETASYICKTASIQNLLTFGYSLFVEKSLIDSSIQENIIKKCHNHHTLKSTTRKSNRFKIYNFYPKIIKIRNKR